MSAMQEEAAQITRVENSREALNSLLGRGVYESISSIDVSFNGAQNEFAYTIRGSCELGHRMMGTNFTFMSYLLSLGLEERLTGRCSVLEFGAPNPPPAAPPPPSHTLHRLHRQLL